MIFFHLKKAVHIKNNVQSEYSLTTLRSPVTSVFRIAHDVLLDCGGRIQHTAISQFAFQRRITTEEIFFQIIELCLLKITQ